MTPGHAMNCPSCSSESTRVVTSRPTIGEEGGRCRWRECRQCQHRWYTWQPSEVLLPSWAVSWFGSDVYVSPLALRRLRGPAS
jgi:hypothetical protein